MRLRLRSAQSRPASLSSRSFSHVSSACAACRTSTWEKSSWLCVRSGYVSVENAVARLFPAFPFWSCGFNLKVESWSWTRPESDSQNIKMTCTGLVFLGLSYHSVPWWGGGGTQHDSKKAVRLEWRRVVWVPCGWAVQVFFYIQAGHLCKHEVTKEILITWKKLSLRNFVNLFFKILIYWCNVSTCQYVEQTRRVRRKEREEKKMLHNFSLVKMVAGVSVYVSLTRGGGNGPWEERHYEKVLSLDSSSFFFSSFLILIFDLSPIRKPF